jgi:hypothetical protein
VCSRCSRGLAVVTIVSPKVGFPYPHKRVHGEAGDANRPSWHRSFRGLVVASAGPEPVVVKRARSGNASPSKVQPFKGARSILLSSWSSVEQKGARQGSEGLLDPPVFELLRLFQLKTLLVYNSGSCAQVDMLRYDCLKRLRNLLT